VIKNFILLLEVNKKDSWFQQEGAMANSAKQILSEFFGGHIIS
jgi:hypothetical protein